MAGCMIAALSSGSGKTMVTCGMLEVLKRMGKNPYPFKCGPDYIDGLFHRKVLGIEGGNLDSFFEDPNDMRKKLTDREGENFVLAEGVMGYFDGLGGISTRASSWEIADILDLPVILVIDARGASLSLSALIHGCLTYKQEEHQKNHIKAVIFNRMSPVMYPRMKELVEREHNIAVAGYIPDLDFLKVESRHLGLMLPEEIPMLKEQMRQLGDCLEETLDWEVIFGLSSQEDTGSRFKDKIKEEKGPAMPSFRLGVARDEAFCFYYRDNLDALKKAGADLIFFSPLHDAHLPQGLDGLLIGGGYPELYGKQLAENGSMGLDIFQAAEDGMPVLAECGGYLYLLEQLEGADGQWYPMAGVLKGRGLKKGKNPRFGYIELTAKEDTPYFLTGERVRGHEFHYWDSDGYEDSCKMKAQKPIGARSWLCMRTFKNVLAGFAHLYYPSCPGFAERVGELCRTYGKERRK